MGGGRGARNNRARTHRVHGSETTTHLRRAPDRTEKEQEMNDTTQSAEDLAILESTWVCVAACAIAPGV
jgi:hypothetical protein